MDFAWRKHSRSLHDTRAEQKRTDGRENEKTAGSGEGGIRTPDAGFTDITVFETAAFNRSATSPRRILTYAFEAVRR
jgi:hypothetical protein